MINRLPKASVLAHRLKEDFPCDRAVHSPLLNHSSTTLTRQSSREIVSSREILKG